MKKIEFTSKTEEIIFYADAILDLFASLRPIPKSDIIYATLSEVFVNFCRSCKVDKMTFRDLCQDLVNQYEEGYEAKIKE